MYKIRAVCKSIYISVGRVGSGYQWVGSGRNFFVFGGSGRVGSNLPRVGLGRVLKNGPTDNSGIEYVTVFTKSYRMITCVRTCVY